MPTFSKNTLSHSTNGKSIVLALSTVPGTLLHTTGTSNSITDEVWLYASNCSMYDSILTLYWGSSASNDKLMQLNVPAYAGPVITVPGLILTGDGSNGTSVYASVTSPSSVNVAGYINRITP